MKHFLTLSDYSKTELEALLALASELKAAQKRGQPPQRLKGKILAMIFEKSSTRTRVSFEAAMLRLGGQAIVLDTTTSQLGRGETYADTARVLSRYVDAIMLRTFAQSNLEEMAAAATIPVVNGLSDELHPVQVMAALLTVLERFGKLEATVAYVGDGNNLANTWITAAKTLDFPLHLACPAGHEPAYASEFQAPHIRSFADPREAVRGAQVVYTDTWFSMGQNEDEAKRALFAPYQVNTALLKSAAPDAIVLHCLPAHRGEEITDEVMDGPQSAVWDEAENRVYAQQAVLLTLLGC